MPIMILFTPLAVSEISTAERTFYKGEDGRQYKEELIEGYVTGFDGIAGLD